MSTWKKLIPSGSDAEFRTVTASGGFFGNGANVTGVVTASYSLTASVLTGTILTSSVTNFDTEVSRSAASFGFGQGSGVSGSVHWNDVEQKPSGLISSSAQISASLSGSSILSGSVATWNRSTLASNFSAAGGAGTLDITGLSSSLNTPGFYYFRAYIEVQNTSGVSSTGWGVGINQQNTIYAGTIYGEAVGRVNSSSHRNIQTSATNERSFSSIIGSSISNLNNNNTGEVYVEGLTYISASSILPTGILNNTGGSTITVKSGSFVEYAKYTPSASSLLLASVESASYAATASLLLGTVTSASYAVTASHLTGTILTSSVTNFDQEVSRSAASYGFGQGSGVSGSVHWDNVEQKPSGIVSSSTQTIANLNGSGILSGSVVSSSYAVTSSHALTASYISGIGGYKTIIGDGIVTASTVTHQLNTQDVHVTTRYVNGGEFIFPDVYATDNDNVFLDFGFVIASASIAVSVIKNGAPSTTIHGIYSSSQQMFASVTSNGALTLTLSNDHNGRVIALTSSNHTSIIASASLLTDGFNCMFVKSGSAGTASFTGSGGSLNFPAIYKSAASTRWSTVTLVKLDSTNFVLGGLLDLA